MYVASEDRYRYGVCTLINFEIFNNNRTGITNTACFVSLCDQVHCRKLTVAQQDVNQTDRSRRVVKIAVVFPTRVFAEQRAMKEKSSNPNNIRREKSVSATRRRRRQRQRKITQALGSVTLNQQSNLISTELDSYNNDHPIQLYLPELQSASMNI